MMHGALVFHRKCLGKRLGHQMYMVVFVEECSMGIFSSWVHCTQFIVWASLIAAVGYRVALLFKVVLHVATMCQGSCLIAEAI